MQLLPDAKSESSALQDCAGTLLEILPGLMRFVRRQMRSRRAKGLSVPQFRVLVQLRRRPAASLSDIAESLGSTAPTTCRIVNGLVRKGLITRRTAREDRRRITLQLTPRGQEAIDRAWGGTQDALAEKLSPLSEAELTRLARSLNLLYEMFPCTCEAAAPSAAH